jgi:hypothetical protein
METSTRINTTIPVVDVIALRALMERAGIQHDQAEAIAIAIDTKVRSSDTSGFSTKAGLSEAVEKLDTKIDNAVKELRGDIHALDTKMSYEMQLMVNKLTYRLLGGGGLIAFTIKLPEVINFFKVWVK